MILLQPCPGLVHLLGGQLPAAQSGWKVEREVQVSCTTSADFGGEVNGERPDDNVPRLDGSRIEVILPEVHRNPPGPRPKSVRHDDG